MLPDPKTMLIILLMALVTYATRAGGLWMANRLTFSGGVERWLEYIPGAILVSIVAPAVLAAGLAEALAAVAVVIVASKTGNLFFSMVTGVVAIVALRALL